jgi:hypothetical protein
VASVTKKRKAKLVWKKAKVARNKSDVVTLASRRRDQDKAVTSKQDNND